MATTAEIKEKIEEGKSLKLITQAFTDISSTKLKRIRARVEKNRSFFDDLTQVYRLVNQLSLQQGLRPKLKNNKVITILISSNFRFYGKITNDLIGYYLNTTATQNVDRLIIGKTAQSYFQAVKFAKPYQTLTLTNDFPNSQELKQMTDIIKNYQQVLVYYSEFKSVLVQIPFVRDITQSVTDIHTNEKSELKRLKLSLHYILEPEIQIMVDFFDAQIKNLLLEQAFLESELARTGSRLITMDNAQNEANNYLKSQKIALFSAQRSILNARILETFSALNIARKHLSQ